VLKIILIKEKLFLERNYKEAVKLFKKACDIGDAKEYYDKLSVKTFFIR
jgi:TPR repeat protein